MNIAGIGTDIISKIRINQILNLHGERFIKRLLTQQEILQLPSTQQQRLNFVSKRWAAKEAVSKAFGTGIGKQLSFQDIEINHDQSGAPVVVLSESAQQLAQQKNFAKMHLSISDEKEYAIAFVVASK